LSYDPTIPFPTINPRGTKTHPHKNQSPMIRAFLTTAKIWKEPRVCEQMEWINKMRSVHAVEYYSAQKRNKSLIHATTQKNLKKTMPSGRIQSQGATNRMIPFIRSV
ncbi:LORF2 protein, partial [Crocuta crocuta]